MSEPLQNESSRSFFIKQLLSKFKFPKNKQQVNKMIAVENSVGESEVTRLQDVISNEEITTQLHEPTDEPQEEKTKFKTFCKEIEKFVKYLRNNDDLRNYLFKYPEILQNRINADTDELQTLCLEVNDILGNIRKLRTQQKLIKKEVSSNKKVIRRIKDNETRELESFLCRYEKDLYNRWTKSKWKSDELEELMFDVQEKQVALDCLVKLINRHLGKPREINLSVEEDDSFTNNVLPLTTSAFSIQSKFPNSLQATSNSITRPMPITINTTNRANTRQSWVQRRFRAEKRGSTGTVRTILENRENEPYAFSFSMASGSGSGSTVDTTSAAFENNPSRLSSESDATIVSRTSNQQVDTTTSDTRRPDEDTELKTEIQSMLQSLFGPGTSALAITDSTESCNS